MVCFFFFFFFYFYLFFFLIYFYFYFQKQLSGIGGEKYLDLEILRRKNPKTHTPITAILINALVCSVCVIVPFNFLVAVTNVFYCFIIIVVCLSMIVLRYNKVGKTFSRPFYAFKSNILVTIMAFFPITISVFVLVTSVQESSLPLLVALGSFLFFFILYIIVKRCKKKVTYHVIN